MSQKDLPESMFKALVWLCTAEGIDGLLWSYLCLMKIKASMPYKGYENSPYYQAFKFIYMSGEDIDDVLLSVNSQITEYLVNYGKVEDLK